LYQIEVQRFIEAKVHRFFLKGAEAQKYEEGFKGLKKVQREKGFP
jgi:hypothetical protein